MKVALSKGPAKKDSKVSKSAMSAREGGVDEEWEKEQVQHKRMQIMTLRE